MHAERQVESGGNYSIVNPRTGAAGAYQFLMSTWQYALQLAGYRNSVYYLAPADTAPPAIQDDAAAQLMMHYYYGYGRSWVNVAEAWYGGPNAIGHPGWSGGPGNPTVGQYAQSVMDLFRSYGGPGGNVNGPPPPGPPPVKPRLTGANRRELQIYRAAAAVMERNIASEIRAIRAAGRPGGGPLVRQHS